MGFQLRLAYIRPRYGKPKLQFGNVLSPGIRFFFNLGRDAGAFQYISKPLNHKYLYHPGSHYMLHLLLLLILKPQAL